MKNLFIYLIEIVYWLWKLMIIIKVSQCCNYDSVLNRKEKKNEKMIIIYLEHVTKKIHPSNMNQITKEKIHLNSFHSFV